MQRFRLRLRARPNTEEMALRMAGSGSQVFMVAGADIRSVQEMLGHESISTTAVYLNVSFEYLARVYAQTHRRAQRVDCV